jgi:hypothetical protein
MPHIIFLFFLIIIIMGKAKSVCWITQETVLQVNDLDLSKLSFHILFMIELPLYIWIVSLLKRLLEHISILHINYRYLLLAQLFLLISLVFELVIWSNRMCFERFCIMELKGVIVEVAVTWVRMNVKHFLNTYWILHCFLIVIVVILYSLWSTVFIRISSYLPCMVGVNDIVSCNYLRMKGFRYGSYWGKLHIWSASSGRNLSYWFEQQALPIIKVKIKD